MPILLYGSETFVFELEKKSFRFPKKNPKNEKQYPIDHGLWQIGSISPEIQIKKKNDKNSGQKS